MEGKTRVSVFIAVFLVICLVLEQTHVEATTDCPTSTSRNCYNVCRLPGTPPQTCARTCGCTLTVVSRNDAREEYCVLGCTIFRCQVTQNSDVGKEIGRGDDKGPCFDKCSKICRTGSEEV